MTFTFTPARRQGSHLLIGLAGPTGSGKTYSALLLASGIVAQTGGRIAFVDTESGRAKQYAPPGDATFAFEYCELGPPFSPDRYREAFEAAEQHVGEHGVVVVDSTSHEHEGPGGLLEWHDQELDRLSNGKADRERYSFMAWAKPKAGRRQLINRILQARCHAIFCFRAKEKHRPVKDQQGRNQIVSIGWQPITGDEWPYEMTIFALLNPAQKGVPVIDGFDQGKLPLNMRSLVPTDRPLDADVGRALAEWSMGQDSEPPHERRTSMVTLRIGAEERQAAIGTAAKDLAGAVQQAGSKDDLDMLVKDNAIWIEELRADWRERLDDVIAEARERVG